MGLARGTKLGSVEILDLIGAGGMGEVYRGRDATLGRDVAVKALPDRLAHDADRLARFEREAQALAALNHPNIAIIHDLKEVAGSKYLIMELVEGETLAEMLAAGSRPQAPASAPSEIRPQPEARSPKPGARTQGLPLVQALPIARQIAEALDAAHERGIVHRDLKPANVKITPDGRVKVLDFGLAKIRSGGTDGAGGASPTNSPTLSALQTAGGVILGTAAYMSPEQARGRDVDKRGDVWAFGCVLYEMLTGRQAFPNGETVSDTLASILTREPDWQALRADTPPRIRALLQRCLQKDVRRRIRDIGDVLVEIEGAPNEPTPAAGVAAPAPSGRREYAAWAIALTFLLTAGGLAIRTLVAPPPEARVVQFDVFPPEGSAMVAGTTVQPLSPDGRTLAFVAGTPGKELIWLRPLDSPTAQSLPGTEGASRPVWSPDGQFLAFFAQGKLKKIAITGGPAAIVSEEGGRDAAWGTDNVMLIGRPGKPLVRVSAAGGRPVPATEFAANETTHDYPEFLPDGRHFLYMARHGGSPADWDVYVGSLDSKERRLLPGIHSGVRYAPTGHVLFLQDPTTLTVQPFDVKRLELTGEAVPITERLARNLSGPFSVSRNGSLAYLGKESGGDSQLAWVDRTGSQLSPASPRGEYRNVDLSPDDQYVAFDRGSPHDVFVLDIRKSLVTRFTSSGAADAAPIWSPDARRLAFLSSRDPAGNMGPTNVNAGNLYERAVGSVGEDKLLLKTETGKTLTDWSRDGRYLIYTSGGDVWALALSASGESKPLRVTQTPFVEDNPRVSPDGRWIAYQSNESAGAQQQEVYVQSFPQPGARQQVSASGGSVPRWRPDGKELFYLAPDFTLMSAFIKPVGGELQVGTPTPLFQTRPPGPGGRDYDVAADGRFLMNVAATEQRAAPITVILNWAAGLKDHP